jgi:hypothetical protein
MPIPFSLNCAFFFAIWDGLNSRNILMKYITLYNLRMMVFGSKVFALLCFVNIDESSLK